MRLTTKGLLATGVVIFSVCVLSGQTGSGSDNKRAIPDKTASDRAEQEIRNLYKGDYAKTKTSDQRELAKKLLKQGLETKDDPTARYVLLREAARLAGLACDFQEAFRAVDALKRDYAVDAVALKMEALQSGSQTANVAGMHRALVEAARSVGDDAIVADQFERARAALELADKSAKKGENPNLPSLIAADLNELKEIEPQYRSSRSAVETLQANPGDAAANLALGRFLCFFKDQWVAGLPHLAKGSDGALAEAAKADLANPSDIAAYVKIGDTWWDLAEKQSGVAQKNLRDRASRWYELALPGLEGGLTKTRVQARVQQVLAVRRSKPAGLDDEKPRFVDVRQFDVKNKVPVRLIGAEEGFCFLSAMGGKFEGGGEQIGVSVGRDNFWYLYGQGAQAIGGRALSLYEVRWRRSFAAKVSEASWQRGRPIRLLSKRDGFCFLSFVTGKFVSAEEVSVHLGGDGDWYLGGKGGGVSAKALIVQTSKPGSFHAEVKEHVWNAGQGPVKMISKKDGFCFLSGVGGGFRGGGEEVSVYVDKDDHWYLTGRSGQPSLIAKAISVRLLNE